MISDLESKRRRTWFRMCSLLGLDESTQRLLADRFIPESCPQKYNRDGEVSRRALFAYPRYWNAAHAWLTSLEKSRRRSRRRLDGAQPTDRAAQSQIRFAFKLARQLGWAERGDDDLRYRLIRFAGRQTGDGAAVRPIDWYTSADMARVIEGLKAMLARQRSSREAV